jgi:chemotaxis protein CheD
VSQAPLRNVVAQGECRVSDHPDEVLTAVLGSCVACCVYDAGARVGGMNHILLPGGMQGDAFDEDQRYGAYLMELLLNEVLKLGGRRNRLAFKIFGGAKLFEARLSPGALNIAFIERFLEVEGYVPEATSLGGDRGRRVEFMPSTGQARMRFLPAGREARLAPLASQSQRPRLPASELELF